jgi:hypothetical protein
VSTVRGEVQAKDFYRCDSLAVRRLLLECYKALALRALLAGLLMFVIAFCGDAGGGNQAGLWCL